MAEHLNRLDRSLAALRIAQPHDRDGWVQLINELLARNIQDTCIVYLQARGVAKRDHQFPAQLVPPTVFGMVSPWAPPSAAQRASGMTAISIPDERWLHCEIKSVSLLGNVLAKQQAVDAQVDEVVQFRDGFLTEGSSTNICGIRRQAAGSAQEQPDPGRHPLRLDGRAGRRGRHSFRVAPHRPRGSGKRGRAAAVLGHQGSAAHRRAGRQAGGFGQARPVYERLRAGYDARIAGL